MPFVRTVLGDILPAEMGLTYSHEHIIIEEGFVTMGNKDFILNDVHKVSEELQHFYNAGGRTVVDTMPAACGRNVMKLSAVSKIQACKLLYQPAFIWKNITAPITGGILLQKRN